MDREKIERMLQAMGTGDYYTKQLASALIDGCPYTEAFKIVPAPGGSALWHTVSCMHEMVIAWEPSEYQTWLRLIRQRLVSRSCDHSHSFFCGSILGMLTAGIWLDRYWETPVLADQLILGTLARVICSSTKLMTVRLNLDQDGFVQRLSEAIKQYILPVTILESRSQLVREFVDYICHNGSDNDFSGLDLLIIERFFYGLTANLPGMILMATTSFSLASSESAAEVAV